MNIDKGRPVGAFDDLLGDSTAIEDAAQTLGEEAKAERDAARRSVARAVSQVRDGGATAARAAHKQSSAISASVRRRAPAVTARVHEKLATQIRWRVVGPIVAVLLASAVLSGLFVLNMHRITARSSSGTDAEQGTPAVATPAHTTTEAGPVPVAATTSTAPSRPAPTPSIQTLTSSSPAIALEPSPAPVAFTPDLPTLPSAPSEPTVTNCSAAVPLLNGLFADAAHARTPEELAWAAFGYRCAQSGALTYDKAGYAAKGMARQTEAQHPPAEVKTADSPATRPTARPAKPAAASAKAKAPTAPAAPVVSSPVTRVSASTPTALGTCVLHGTTNTNDGVAIPSAPVEIAGVDGQRFEQRTTSDAQGHFQVSVPTGSRMRVVLRAHGYLDDVLESMNCSPVALSGKKSNPFSSLFDAARRADRSIQGGTGHR